MRRERDQPYRADHDASVRRSMAQRGTDPTFDQLLRWFVERFLDETPTQIHVSGVEWSPPGRIVRGAELGFAGVTDPGGGNDGGAPRLSQPFRRRVLEGVTSDVEHPVSDGRPEMGVAYSTPMNQTITFISRKHPLLAAWLRSLGHCRGDWRAVGEMGLMLDQRGAHVALPDEYAEQITRGALALAWRHFLEVPTRR